MNAKVFSNLGLTKESSFATLVSSAVGMSEGSGIPFDVETRPNGLSSSLSTSAIQLALVSYSLSFMTPYLSPSPAPLFLSLSPTLTDPQRG